MSVKLCVLLVIGVLTYACLAVDKPTCEDVSQTDFGNCNSNLGWGINSSGKCYQVKGCDQSSLSSQEKRLWEEEYTCEQSCEYQYYPTCNDVSSYDWGSCSSPYNLGWGVMHGSCVQIRGCNQESLNLDGGRLWYSQNACQQACDPYKTTCKHLDDHDWGTCSNPSYLGWGVVNGKCTRIRGCYQDQLHDEGDRLWYLQSPCKTNCEIYKNTCNSVENYDWGSCSDSSKSLGWGVIHGSCVEIFGCDQNSLYDNNLKLWSSESQCHSSCEIYKPTCESLDKYSWGSCSNPSSLGWGVIDNSCQEITGCYQDELHDDGYALWYSKSNCQASCRPKQYSPTCTDVGSYSWGTCDTSKSLGWGIVSGSCQQIHGCSQYALGEKGLQLWSSESSCENSCSDINCSSNSDWCDDYDPCTLDSCSSSGCSSTPIDCDDGNSCTNDYCQDGECYSDNIC